MIFIEYGVYLLINILFCSIFGYYLDIVFNTKPIFIIIISLAGLFLTMYVAYKKLEDKQ
jgi:F0F1-type ATP synthase assembly protein I